MPGWRDEYLASIREQEKNNPVNLELVEFCSQLSDRIASLEAENKVIASKADSTNTTSTSSQKPPPPKTPADASTSSSDPTIAQLRLDLAEALRSQGTLQSRARKAEDEVAELRAKAKSDARLIRDLSSDRTALGTKLKDREHEIREKKKLVEDVQDEMISLNLQVSMAEKKLEEAKADNKDLTDRWMRKMHQEAEAMNLANEK